MKHLYMAYSEMEQCLFTALNTDTSELYFELIPFDSADISAPNKDTETFHMVRWEKITDIDCENLREATSSETSFQG